jgi:deoxyribonuclease-4
MTSAAQRQCDGPTNQAQTDDCDPGDAALSLRGKRHRQTGLFPGFDAALHVVELGQPNRRCHLAGDRAPLPHFAHEQNSVAFQILSRVHQEGIQWDQLGVWQCAIFRKFVRVAHVNHRNSLVDELLCALNVYSLEWLARSCHGFLDLSGYSARNVVEQVYERNQMNMTPRVGAHLNGGVKGAIAHARKIGLGIGTADGAIGGPIQMWSRNPSAWRATVHADKDVAAFREGCTALDLGPVFVHGIYLMNFCSANDELWDKSVGALVDHLTVGAQLGAAAVVIHPGSGGDQSVEQALDRCAQAVRLALQQTEHVKQRPKVGLEVCAGAGKTIGRTFTELAALINRLDAHPDVAVVLDTAHMWGSGCDLATVDGLAVTMKDLVSTGVSERVVCVHANDSKVPLGSQKDRHENIGQGEIGEAAFERMLADPLLGRLPWVMEVPGYDGEGPDAQNLAVLRRLAGAAAAA